MNAWIDLNTEHTGILYPYLLQITQVSGVIWRCPLGSSFWDLDATSLYYLDNLANFLSVDKDITMDSQWSVYNEAY